MFFGLRGVRPIRIFQAIASGLLGRAAFSGGPKPLAVVVNGLLIHMYVWGWDPRRVNRETD